MLPKRSTSVDQNLGSESIDSKLSVAIFIVPRNLLVTLNDVIYQKTFQKLRNPWGPTPLVSFWRDIYDHNPLLSSIYFEGNFGFVSR